MRAQYGAELVVMNIGDIITTGPTEAPYVIDTLVKPTAFIPSHANEEATRDGKVIAGTKQRLSSTPQRPRCMSR